MKLLAVGDGPRDQRALPTLVCKILDVELESRYDDWHQVRVRKQRGTIYARKLKYLTRRARADGFAALAIVVDTDKSPARQKLRELRTGRNEDRQNQPPFPTALGEANPHFDVWLLDDPVAIREALQLPLDVLIPNAIKSNYPKDSLSELIDLSAVEFGTVSDALGEMAQRFSTLRCAHRKVTGFSAFEEEVLDEIKPVSSA